VQVLVTGATGRVGRLVVDELLRAGVPVRALTRRPEQAALPAGVEVVAGDLTTPASLDVALHSLSQAEQVRAIGEAIGRPLRFEELSPDEFRRETAAKWPEGIAEMLLTAWRATLGHPAFVTSAVQEIVGAPPRTLHQWAADNAAAFDDPGSGPKRSPSSDR
jgi:uncharacterized protein YbjT (DUF2867 family)